MLTHPRALERRAIDESAPPFSLAKHQRVWIVHEGELEVFVVRTADGKDASALHALMSVGQGGAVFGMRDDDGLGIGLVAKPSPHASVIEYLVTRFGDVMVPDDEPRDAYDLVKGWVATLSRVA